jgi:hypothetical protein
MLLVLPLAVASTMSTSRLIATSWLLPAAQPQTDEATN